MVEEHNLVLAGEKIGLDFTTGQDIEYDSFDELVASNNVKEYFAEKKAELAQKKQQITQLKLDQMNSEFEQNEKIAQIISEKEDKIQDVLRSELRYLDSQEAIKVIDTLITNEEPEPVFPVTQAAEVDNLKNIVRKRAN